MLTCIEGVQDKNHAWSSAQKCKIKLTSKKHDGHLWYLEDALIQRN